MREKCNTGGGLVPLPSAQQKIKLKETQVNGKKEAQEGYKA